MQQHNEELLRKYLYKPINWVDVNNYVNYGRGIYSILFTAEQDKIINSLLDECPGWSYKDTIKALANRSWQKNNYITADELREIIREQEWKKYRSEEADRQYEMQKSYDKSKALWDQYQADLHSDVPPRPWMVFVPDPPTRFQKFKQWIKSITRNIMAGIQHMKLLK